MNIESSLYLPYDPDDPDYLEQCDLRTPQESNLLGGTFVDIDPGSADWYRPIAFHHIGKPTKSEISEIEAERQRRGCFISPLVAMLAGLFGQRAVIAYADLDPENGQTKEDPEIVGILEEGTRRIIPFENNLKRRIIDRLNRSENPCYNREVLPRAA